MSQAGWAAITSNGPGAVAWPPPAILWPINEAPNTQSCLANRQIGKVQNINSFKLRRNLN